MRASIAVFSISGVNGADGLVHGKRARGRDNFAEERGIGSLINAFAFVGGTFENRDIAREVADKQRAVRIEQDVGIKFIRLADAR